jgi:flagellar biosynthesis protein FlhF
MQPETFRAKTAAAALAEVQRKLGPDALVISVRQAAPVHPWQVWQGPEVEVLAMPPVHLPPRAFKMDEEPEQAAGPAGQATAHKAVNPQAANDGGAKPYSAAERATALADGSEGRARTEAAAQVAGEKTPLPPSLVKLRNRLAMQGVDISFIQQMLSKCQATLSTQAIDNEAKLRSFAAASLQAVIHIARPAVVRSHRVIFVVGSSGSGKTSLCARLAAYHQRLGRNAAWVCADTYKAGAIHEAQAYCTALQIPLAIAYSPEDVHAHVQDMGEFDLILIDTQRANPFQEAGLVELGNFLSAVPERAAYLAASANSKESDLQQAVAALTPLGLTGLALTHMDETNTFGNLFNLAWKSALPLVYTSHGTRALESLQPAEAETLINALLSD